MPSLFIPDHASDDEYRLLMWGPYTAFHAAAQERAAEQIFVRKASRRSWNLGDRYRNKNRWTSEMGAKWRNVKKQSSNDTYWLETCRTMMREHVLPHVDFAGLFKLNTSSERYPLRILELCCAPGGFAEAIMEHVKGSQGRSPLYFGLTLPERDGGLRLSLKPHFYYPGFWSNEDWLKGPRERGLLAELAAERVIGGFVPIIMDVNDVNAKDLEGSCPPLHQRSFHIVITDGAWSGLGVAEAVAMKLNQIAAALKVLKPGGTLICRGRCSGFWADIVALFFLIFREVKLVKPSSGLSSSLQTNSFCIYVLSGFREEVAEFPIDDKGTTARFKREQLVDWVLSLRDILLAVGPVGLTQTPESTGTPMVAVTSEETILEMNSISSDVVELKPASLRSSGVGFRAEKEVTLSVELLGSFRRRQSSRDVGAEMSRVVTLSVELLGSLRNFLKPAETPRIAEYPTDEHKTTTSTLQSEASTVTSPLNRPNRTAWLRMRRALEWTLVSPVTAAAVHELFRKTALIRSTNFVEVALQLAFHSVMLPESLYKLLHRPDVLSRIYGVSEEAPSGVIPLIHRQKFVREWDFYDIVSWGAEMTAPMLELGAKHLDWDVKAITVASSEHPRGVSSCIARVLEENAPLKEQVPWSDPPCCIQLCCSKDALQGDDKGDVREMSLSKLRAALEFMESTQTNPDVRHSVLYLVSDSRATPETTARYSHVVGCTQRFCCAGLGSLLDQFKRRIYEAVERPETFEVDALPPVLLTTPSALCVKTEGLLEKHVSCLRDWDEWSEEQARRASIADDLANHNEVTYALDEYVSAAGIHVEELQFTNKLSVHPLRFTGTLGQIRAALNCMTGTLSRRADTSFATFRQKVKEERRPNGRYRFSLASEDYVNNVTLPNKTRYEFVGSLLTLEECHSWMRSQPELFLQWFAKKSDTMEKDVLAKFGGLEALHRAADENKRQPPASPKHPSAQPRRTGFMRSAQPYRLPNTQLCHRVSETENPWPNQNSQRKDPKYFGSFRPESSVRSCMPNTNRRRRQPDYTRNWQ